MFIRVIIISLHCGCKVILMVSYLVGGDSISGGVFNKLSHEWPPRRPCRLVLHEPSKSLANFVDL